MSVNTREILRNLSQTAHIVICTKQAELNQAESEVENSKRHLQHYEEKQREHEACINKHKDLLVSKGKELEVRVVGGFLLAVEVGWSWFF